MVRSAVLGLLVLISGCAGNRASPTRATNAPIELTEKGHGLFVGHTDNGEVVISATHYNAMNGLAVLDTDLGIPAKESGGMMLCQRQVMTGTHLPKWVCRYQADIERERTASQIGLAMPVASPHVSQGGPTISLGTGGTGHYGKTAAQ